MDEKTLKALEKFGLSKKEAKVYSACLELDSSPAFDIAVKADIPRTLTYDILERLIELGLVSYAIKENKKYFRAAPPFKLIEILKEKQSAVSSIMETLTKLHNLKAEKKPEVDIYEGKEGLKTIFEDILKSKVKEYLAIGGSGLAPKLLPYYLPGFYRRKEKLNINVKVIFHDTKEARERAKQLKEYGLCDVRYIPKKYATPISLYVYGNKTSLLMWSKLEPLAVLIDCKYITEGFTSYILALWEGAKKR